MTKAFKRLSNLPNSKEITQGFKLLNILIVDTWQISICYKN